MAIKGLGKHTMFSEKLFLGVLSFGNKPPHLSYKFVPMLSDGS